MKIFIYFMLTLMCCVKAISAADKYCQYQAVSYPVTQQYFIPTQPINIPKTKSSSISSQPMYSPLSNYSSTTNSPVLTYQTNATPSSNSLSYSSSPDVVYMWPTPSAPPATINECTCTISTQQSPAPTAHTRTSAAQTSSAPQTSYGACMSARGSEHIPGPQAELISLVSKLKTALCAIPPAHRPTHVKTLLESLNDDGNLEIAAAATERGTKTGNGAQRDFRHTTDKTVQGHVQKIVAALEKAHAFKKK